MKVQCAVDGVKMVGFSRQLLEKRFNEEANQLDKSPVQCLPAPTGLIVASRRETVVFDIQRSKHATQGFLRSRQI